MYLTSLEPIARQYFSAIFSPKYRQKLISLALRSRMLQRPRSEGAFLPFTRSYRSDIFAGVSLGSGWLPSEYDGQFLWRWMEATATIVLPRSSDKSAFLLIGFRSLDDNSGNTLRVSGPLGAVDYSVRFGYNVFVVRRSDIATMLPQTIKFSVTQPHKEGHGLMITEIATTDAIRANGSGKNDYYRAGAAMRSYSDLQRMIGLAHHMAAHSTGALMKLFSIVHYEFPTPPSDPTSSECTIFWKDQYTAITGSQYSVSNESHDFDEEFMENVFPYCTNEPGVIGKQLIAIGNMIASMNLPVGSSILEMGVGWGNTALQLGLSGYNCTVLDIERKFIEIVKRRFERKKLPIKTILGDFFEIEKIEEKFDAVLFFECFHHCDDHIRLIDSATKVLKPGGRLVFAGEPITKELPYPWGLNPAGQGIWSIGHYGWFELCFHEDYFLKVLKSRGFMVTRYPCAQTPAGVVFIAQKM